MFSNPLVARGSVVSSTQHALRYGGDSLRNVPGLLKRVIREDLWHEYLAANGEVVTFDAFHAFVTSPWGLDTTLTMIQHICADDLEALDELDKVTTAKRGAREGNQHAAKTVPVPLEPQGVLIPSEEEKTNPDNISICFEREPAHGTSRTYALRRLRKDRPDLHARVLAGELSPHQGMLEAGFRHQPTALDYLHRYWRQVPQDDRLRFLLEMLTPNERRLLSTGLWPDEEAP